MAINLALYTGSAVTVSTTEISLTAGTTSLQSRTDSVVPSLVLDCNAVVAGDEFELAFYEKAISGGTQRKEIVGYINGSTGPLYLWTLGIPVGIGWELSIKRTAGSDRAFTWSIRAV